MSSCDAAIWMNGLIFTTMGIGFFLSAFLLNTTLRQVVREEEAAGGGGMTFRENSKASCQSLILSFFRQRFLSLFRIYLEHVLTQHIIGDHVIITFVIQNPRV